MGVLMCRGEALEDFTGLDCRFVISKKGDPVYDCCKLAGGSPEVWAGNVGHLFEYFPKDLMQVVHEYTKEELQVPTDETYFDIESQESASADLGDDFFHSTPHTTIEPEYSDKREDLPIIMPYNVEKVFCASASEGLGGAMEGPITTEDPPVGSVAADKQLEMVAEEPANVTLLENAAKLLVSTLPDDVQPGPDCYGLPWKPVLTNAFLGIASIAFFFWGTILVVSKLMYTISHKFKVLLCPPGISWLTATSVPQVQAVLCLSLLITEQQISEKVKIIMKENTELLQKLSNYERKIKESKKHIPETRKQNRILSDEAIKFK
ncbi:Transport and Golgi organization protein 1-like protein, partial [Plecturocebus cupreus]